MSRDLMSQIAADLKQDEGWVPHAYQDHLGFWTLGYGFLIDQRRGGQIPRPVADFWLQWEIDQRWKMLSDALPWFEDAPGQVQRALVSMCYQLGLRGLLSFRQTLALLEDGRYTEAADQALQSRWAEQARNRAMRVTDWIRAA